MTLNQVRTLKKGDPISYLNGLFIITEVRVSKMKQKTFQCLLMLPTERRDVIKLYRNLPGIPNRKESSFADRSFSFHESMLIMPGFKP
jgi:hypothetical protein